MASIPEATPRHTAARHTASRHTAATDRHRTAGHEPDRQKPASQKPASQKPARSIHDQLWAFNAERLQAHLMAGNITTADIVRASLERIGEVNPELNAIIDVYEDEAIAAATEVQRSRRRHRRLRGVPVTIKDNIESKGHIMSDGSVTLKNNRCTQDAPLVSRLRDGGALIMGRTNCPPFCWQLFGSNELYGSTLNPVNHRYTPGGSSAGAAASVASGMVPIAHGNDVAGSIRYPAYANAIVGIKPTTGLIPGSDTPQDRPFAFQMFASQGLLARTVTDARLGFDAMRGYAAGDPASIACEMEYDAQPHRVGVYLGDEISVTTPSVRNAVLHAARGFEEMGWTVEYIETDAFRQLFRLEILLLFGQFLHSGADEIAAGGEILRRGLAGAHGTLETLYGDGYRLTLDDYIAGLAERGSAIRKLRKLQDRYPIIITPASAETPFLLDEDQTASRERAIDMTFSVWPMYAPPIAGLPGMVLPTDVEYDGIHLGVQLLARVYDENTLFRAGRDLERYFALDHDPVDPR
ncbi:amidase family protein [Bifidobacterium simiarum]|uniref:amidase family protein n=1 Tax=Bifidobacterium simiarum TaxID=2045441 RepID=UPI001BDBD77E|nr:amidase family protein [Bifidobacterium simiarum]MBT1166661.1 hypothetical protein [Bifidobacterium simiarum]